MFICQSELVCFHVIIYAVILNLGYTHVHTKTYFMTIPCMCVLRLVVGNLNNVTFLLAPRVCLGESQIHWETLEIHQNF